MFKKRLDLQCSYTQSKYACDVCRGILSKSVSISNHRGAHFKHLTILYVSYASVKPKKYVWGSIGWIYYSSILFLTINSQHGRVT